MQSDRILVVDDDPSIQGYLQNVLTSHGYSVSCLGSERGVLEQLSVADRPSIVLLDLVMPASDGMEVLEKIHNLDEPVPVIVISGLGHSRSVVRAMRLGAADYLVKPFEEEELADSVRSVLDETRVRSTSSLRLLTTDQEDLFGGGSTNPRIARIREIAAQVADTDAPVLILGETGVGKEMLARYIHSVSARRDQPLIKVNCAALPGELLESELFGHERGAFTGALREKPGKFELAGKGTILLDEIAEMSPLLQAKLLHVLQDGECCRLGGTKPVRVGARILAATNRSLEESVTKGEFRQDLLYRLDVVRLELPPLRSRIPDIPRLCDVFLDKYCSRYGRPRRELPEQLMSAFQHYSWPGNIRQLENVVRRFVILPDVDLALADLARAGTNLPVGSDPAATSLREQAALAAEAAERELVLRTLDELNWNRKAAAKRLNICYKSLLNKLHKWQTPGRSQAKHVEA